MQDVAAGGDGCASTARELSQHEQAALAELKDLLTREYEGQDIRLFGSKARGTAHNESDFDLFIVVPQLDWDTEKVIYTLCFDLSLKYYLLLAPTLYSRAELANPRLQAAPFYRTVQAEGGLYEPGAYCAESLSTRAGEGDP